MTRTTITRRGLLATLGAVAVGGCTDSSTDYYWSDPPSFDDDGLDDVADEPLPERPSPLPVAVAPERVEQFATRVDDLLVPVPEGLDATTVPNGVIREEILDARRQAREDRERLRAATDAVETVTAAADACRHAARAAGVWIHVSTAHETTDLPLSPDAVREEHDGAADAVPDVAATPLEGAVVYGPLEDWLRRREPPSPATASTISLGRTPIATGDRAADAERVRALVAGARHLRERYVAGLDDAASIADDLEGAVEELREPADERVSPFRDDDGGGVGFRAEEVLSRAPTRGEPGADLLDEKLEELFWRGSLYPSALQDEPTDWPAISLRNTQYALAALDALEELRTRVDDGDDLFPADAGAVADARTAAVDAVQAVADAEDPLTPWYARDVVAELERADAVLEPPADDAVGRSVERRVADAYGTYVWTAAVAEGVPDASELVQRALD